MYNATKENGYIRRDGGRYALAKNVTSLKVIVEGEVAVVVVHIGRALLGGLLVRASHDASLLVVTHSLLEEVGLATKRDVLHEVEGVGRVVDLVIAQGDQQAVRHEFNVLFHQVGVHAKKGTGQSLREELLLNGDSIGNDIRNHLLASAVLQVRMQQTGEVGVETLITGDELVGEGQSRHQTTLLQPEDGGKSTAEEDTLNSGKRDQALCKSRLAVLDPMKSPIGLLTDAGNYKQSVIVSIWSSIGNILVSMALKRY